MEASKSTTSMTSFVVPPRWLWGVRGREKQHGKATDNNVPHSNAPVLLIDVGSDDGVERNKRGHAHALLLEELNTIQTDFLRVHHDRIHVLAHDDRQRHVVPGRVT
jgi:hypothetical protein